METLRQKKCCESTLPRLCIVFAPGVYEGRFYLLTPTSSSCPFLWVMLFNASVLLPLSDEVLSKQRTSHGGVLPLGVRARICAPENENFL